MGRKAFIAILLSCVLLSFSICKAKIQTEVDNWSDTISFRCDKTVTHSSITQYNFMKTVGENNKANYYLRLQLDPQSAFNFTPRYLLEKTMDIAIDGKVYKAYKLVNEWHPRVIDTKITVEALTVWYKFPQDVIDAMSQCTGKLDMKVYFPNPDKNTVIVCDKQNVEEIQQIIKYKFSDYMSLVEK